ncbi:HAD hydrolase family protein [Candidatus Kapabacteria bacterium]|nr:HAD hydrolase family protein [Candidatus Kapabacteria bacterium]
MKEELKEKLINIKLMVFDIDGTLTDGSIYYGHQGEMFKRFGAKDGMGITLLRKSEIKTAFLTSEESEINIKRANKLKVNALVQGSHNKSEDLKSLCKSFNLKLFECGFVGDDINDLHAMSIAGFSAAPSSSSNPILENVDFVSKYKGGKGAVREIIEMLLLSQNKSIILQENW